MPDAHAWMVTLLGATPGIETPLLRVIAKLLAAGDAIPMDVLLIVLDALAEERQAAMLDQRARAAAQIEVLRFIVEREAARPGRGSGDGSRIGQRAFPRPYIAARCDGLASLGRRPNAYMADAARDHRGARAVRPRSLRGA